MQHPVLGMNEWICCVCEWEGESEPLLNAAFFVFAGGLGNKDSSAKVKTKLKSDSSRYYETCVCLTVREAWKVCLFCCITVLPLSLWLSYKSSPLELKASSHLSEVIWKTPALLVFCCLWWEAPTHTEDNMTKLWANGSSTVMGFSNSIFSPAHCWFASTTLFPCACREWCDIVVIIFQLKWAQWLNDITPGGFTSYKWHK